MGGREQNHYDEEYYKNYKSSGGQAYEHGNGWEEIFGRYADRIVKEIRPYKTLDVGCAKGFLVEALRDRGVEAYGVDISEYAVSHVREDIRPYCRVESVLEMVREKYDLITCIEVLEHIRQEDIPLAVQRLCEASDDIVFSSTPFDYEEESHVSVHIPAYWAEQFAYNGFYHDVQYDCSYISIQAMRFRRGEKSRAELIRDYEHVLFQKHQETVAARQRYQTSQENVQIYKEAYQKHVDMINHELNPKIMKLQETVEHSQVRIGEEVERRRHLEEENGRLEKKLEEDNDRYVKELEDAAEVIRCMEQLIYKRSFESAASLSVTIQKYYQRKKDEKELLQKGIQYFSPVFDPGYYAEYHEDICEVVGTDAEALLRHFIAYGMHEGRRANREFDVIAYIEHNPDVAKAMNYDFRGCYLHYIVYGKEEGRRTK